MLKVERSKVEKKYSRMVFLKLTKMIRMIKVMMMMTMGMMMIMKKMVMMMMMMKKIMMMMKMNSDSVNAKQKWGARNTHGYF